MSSIEYPRQIRPAEANIGKLAVRHGGQLAGGFVVATPRDKSSRLARQPARQAPFTRALGRSRGDPQVGLFPSGVNIAQSGQLEGKSELAVCTLMANVHTAREKRKVGEAGGAQALMQCNIGPCRNELIGQIRELPCEKSIHNIDTNLFRA